MSREEQFKISKLSICHSCTKINEKCSMKWKNCGTDSKEGKSYVQSCIEFNGKNNLNKKDG